MTSEPQRILLTFDCGVVDAEAFDAMRVLTGDGDVEVTGLYVEDEELLRAAELPDLPEVSHHGTVTSLDLGQLTAAINAQARQIRASFEAIARRSHFKYSFQVTRGRAADALIEAAGRSDLVVINRSLRTTGLRTRLGSHFERLVQVHGNLLFINEPWTSGTSVVVLCELAPDACERALAAARRVAEAQDLRLVMAVPTDRAGGLDRSRDQVVVLAEWTEQAITDLCEAEDARLLVLPPTVTLDWRKLLVSLVDRLSCSLLRLEG